MVRLERLALVVLATLLLGAATEAGETHRVSPDDDLAKAVARLKPGDTLLLTKGTYEGRMVVENLHGTAEAPITIRGESRNGVVFDGRCRQFPHRPKKSERTEEARAPIGSKVYLVIFSNILLPPNSHNYSSYNQSHHYRFTIQQT